MNWDHAECNLFSSSTGSFVSLHKRMIKAFELLGRETEGFANQEAAQNGMFLNNVMISTDPPYYDNIGYADLSDFFYFWMRQSLKTIYPQLFRTLLVPKAEELIATPFRHDGNTQKAKEFFEEGMYKTCLHIYEHSREDIPVTIYYAYKQSDSVQEEGDNKHASSGWETMLSSIVKAGFTITGTWPVKTETVEKLKSNINALASRACSH